MSLAFAVVFIYMYCGFVVDCGFAGIAVVCVLFELIDALRVVYLCGFIS